MPLPIPPWEYRRRHRSGGAVRFLAAVVNIDRSVVLTWVDSPGATNYTVQEDATSIGTVAQGVQTYTVVTP